jgi:hypothetical protein
MSRRYLPRAFGFSAAEPTPAPARSRRLRAVQEITKGVLAPDRAQPGASVVEGPSSGLPKE